MENQKNTSKQQGGRLSSLYPDFKSEEDEFVYEDIGRNDSIKSVIQKVVSRSKKTLEDTERIVERSEIERAVTAIDECNVLAFFCMGSSALAGENGVLRFFRVGKKCLLFRDPGIQNITAAGLDENCVAFGISNSGRSISTVNALRIAKECGATTIGITSFEDSPILKYSDIQLFSACKSAPQGPAVYQESMIAKLSQLLIIDIIYSAYAVKRFDNTLGWLEKTWEPVVDTRMR